MKTILKFPENKRFDQPHCVGLAFGDQGAFLKNRPQTRRTQCVHPNFRPWLVGNSPKKLL
jgi:hypothetical protein